MQVRADQRTRIKAKLPAWVEILVIVVLLALALFGSAYALGPRTAASFLALPRRSSASRIWALAACRVLHLDRDPRRPAPQGRSCSAPSSSRSSSRSPRAGPTRTCRSRRQVIIFATDAPGPEHRRRPRRPARPRVRRLPRRRRLHRRPRLRLGVRHGRRASPRSGPPSSSAPASRPIFGLIIGAPTLRLRGDYLAIVTLGFGEIFRIAMGNLDGNTGPNITNGPNGIPAIPDLVDLRLQLRRDAHRRRHHPRPVRQLLLADAALHGLRRHSSSAAAEQQPHRPRPGSPSARTRPPPAPWASTASGLKLFAFALGASLAGMAGTVRAHVSDVSVTPDQYRAVLPNSAFLLAAVVLGGMGTVGRRPHRRRAPLPLPEKLGSSQRLPAARSSASLLVLHDAVPARGHHRQPARKLEFHEDGPGAGRTRPSEIHLERRRRLTA